MALRDELKATLVTAEVSAERDTFLVSKNLLQVDRLALMASVEDRLEDKRFPILKAARVPVTEFLPGRHHKPWHLARTAMAESKRSTPD